MFVAYDPRDGRVRAVSAETEFDEVSIEEATQAEPLSPQRVAEVDEGRVARPITGTCVDDVEAPTETHRDESLQQESDIKELHDARAAVDKELRKMALERAQQNGAVPDHLRSRLKDDLGLDGA